MNVFSTSSSVTDTFVILSCSPPRGPYGKVFSLEMVSGTPKDAHRVRDRLTWVSSLCLEALAWAW